ncbi:MAG: hypothetical protein QW260_05545 [Thermoproteota archaeon]
MEKRGYRYTGANSLRKRRKSISFPLASPREKPCHPFLNGCLHVLLADVVFPLLVIGVMGGVVAAFYPDALPTLWMFLQNMLMFIGLLRLWPILAAFFVLILAADFLRVTLRSRRS